MKRLLATALFSSCLSIFILFFTSVSHTLVSDVYKKSSYCVTSWDFPLHFTVQIMESNRWLAALIFRACLIGPFLLWLAVGARLISQLRGPSVRYISGGSSAGSLES